MSAEEALGAADQFLGDGYKEIAPGVFKSSDGTRMVRMTESDLQEVGNHAGGPHFNFETGETKIKPNGKETFVSKTNKHVYIKKE